jgi:hypothetical protein
MVSWRPMFLACYHRGLDLVAVPAIQLLQVWVALRMSTVVTAAAMQAPHAVQVAAPLVQGQGQGSMGRLLLRWLYRMCQLRCSRSCMGTPRTLRMSSMRSWRPGLRCR